MKNKTIKILKFLSQEKFLFLIAVSFTLIPVLSFRFYPTMDGAAHLYNSNLINEILFKSNDTVSNFFLINNKPVPNLIGHVILSFFNLILPAFLAEKAFLTLYVIGLSYSFRKLIKSVNPQNVLISYFIFPFVYSFVFTLGFYNFSIALVFLFITLNYWLINENKHLGTKQIILLFVLFSATFFSHIFVFAILLLSIGILFLFRNVANNRRSNDRKKSTLKSLETASSLFLSATIPFILFLHYFYSRPPASDINHLSTKELSDNLISFRPLLSNNKSEEQVYIKQIAFAFIVLVAVVILVRLWNLIRNYQVHQKLKGVFQYKDLWLFIGFILFVMYYIIADSTSYGGFVTTRVSLILYLVIMVWISAHKIPKIFSILAVGIMFYSHYYLVTYYTSFTKKLNEVAADCEEASQYIKPNSIVLPLNYSNEWLAIHFSNYLGIEKPLIILDNYEAVNDYFPLKWNWSQLTTPIYDNIAVNDFLCIDSSTYLNQAHYSVDYMFILDDIENKNDKCSSQKKIELKELTNLVFENKNCKVYKLK